MKPCFVWFVLVKWTVILSHPNTERKLRRLTDRIDSIETTLLSLKGDLLDMESRLISENRNLREDVGALIDTIRLFERRLNHTLLQSTETVKGDADDDSYDRNFEVKTDIPISVKWPINPNQNTEVKKLVSMIRKLTIGFQTEKAINARNRRNVAVLGNSVERNAEHLQSLTDAMKEIVFAFNAFDQSLRNKTEEMLISFSVHDRDVIKQVGIGFNETLRQLRSIKTRTNNQFENITDFQIYLAEQMHIIMNKTDRMHLSHSCSELFDRGFTNDGVYTIVAKGQKEVYCDMATDGGGWIVIQRRVNGSEDFFRDWQDYKTGFGTLYGNFWLGNELISLLTLHSRQELRVDLTDFDDESRFAKYDAFQVATENDNYRMTVGEYSGTAGDSMARQNGDTFHTKDRDNTHGCVKTYGGAWWYANCFDSNLNGRYIIDQDGEKDGIVWSKWEGRGFYYSFKRAEMKIRPIL